MKMNKNEVKLLTKISKMKEHYLHRRTDPFDRHGSKSPAHPSIPLPNASL